MRTIEIIQTEAAEIGTQIATIRSTKAAEIAAAKKAIEDKYREDESRLTLMGFVLSEELDRAKAAAASHPLEGRAVTYRETRYNHSYYGKSSSAVTLRGIIKIVRDYTDLPNTNNTTRGHRMPAFGQAFVQRVDAKGKELSSWVLINDGETLPRNWQVVEENA